MYAIPAITTAALILQAYFGSLTSVYQVGYLAASLCCIAGISGLASQKTARIGNSFGIIGIATGVLTALSAMNFPPALLMQALALLGIGGGLGAVLGKKVAVT